jgi:hypothetical protein
LKKTFALPPIENIRVWEKLPKNAPTKVGALINKDVSDDTKSLGFQYVLFILVAVVEQVPNSDDREFEQV